MTDYRAVARHVRYWRGQIHRWSTVYPLTGSLSGPGATDVLSKIATMENNVNYKGPSTGFGGLYEVALYDQASGGTPIAVSTLFPYATPASWIPYTGGYWGSQTQAAEPVAEVALSVSWLAGLSSSGKPVRFRKWYHAVPESQSSGATVDVSAANVTSIQNGLMSALASLSTDGLVLGNARRLAALSPVVSPYYENHQMPRGRRRSVKELAAELAHAQHVTTGSGVEID